MRGVVHLAYKSTVDRHIEESKLVITEQRVDVSLIADFVFTAFAVQCEGHFDDEVLHHISDCEVPLLYPCFRIEEAPVQ